MKYKTTELIGRQLDEAVFRADGLAETRSTIIKITNFGSGRGGDLVSTNVPAYSSDWAHGGPVIEREHIGILPATKEVKADRNYRRRTGYHFMPEQDGWVAGYDPITHIEFDWGGGSPEIGPTPLVAAMRAFVAAKLGAEVDL